MTKDRHKDKEKRNIIKKKRLEKEDFNNSYMHKDFNEIDIKHLFIYNKIEKRGKMSTSNPHSDKSIELMKELVSPLPMTINCKKII